MASSLLAKFRADGPTKLMVVADFDWTFTKYGSPILHEAFPPDLTVRKELETSTTTLQQAQRAMNSHFLRLSSTCSSRKCRRKLMEDWWNESNRILLNSGITKELIRESPQYLVWRDDAREVFQVLETAGVPLVICSGGISNVIELAIGNFLGQVPRNVEVIANTMEFDENGILTSWGRLVHSMNKNEILRERNWWNGDRHNVFVIGDSEDDAGMMDGRSGSAIKVLVSPQKLDNSSFDLHLPNEDLSELAEIFKSVIV